MIQLSMCFRSFCLSLGTAVKTCLAITSESPFSRHREETITITSELWIHGFGEEFAEVWVDVFDALVRVIRVYHRTCLLLPFLQTADGLSLPALLVYLSLNGPFRQDLYMNHSLLIVHPSLTRIMIGSNFFARNFEVSSAMKLSTS